MNWQHLNILAATNYLRERIASGVPDSKAKDVYDGLLDVLDPSRIEKRAAALQDAKVRLKADAASQPAIAKATTRRAKPVRRRPSRPARPAKPRRR